MRAIVTGGGTGGHIYPAFAIADKIKEKDSDAEILYVGNDIGLEKDIVPGSGYPMADLKGSLDLMAKKLFGPETRTKFRPHHFPFTEPSAEMDVSCFKCGGKGCPVCKGSGWIEILGCGMTHPHVHRSGGIDTEKYTGFAVGMGVERIAMLQYGIDDIRLLYENDMLIDHLMLHNNSVTPVVAFVVCISMAVNVGPNKLPMV